MNSETGVEHVMRQTARIAKRFPLLLMFGRWRKPSRFETGYTILLPSPMDMPFMLRLGLEGLKRINTTHCREILIIPDGLGNDNGRGLREVAAEFHDPRIRLLQPDWRYRLATRGFGPTRFAAIHWLMVVAGTEAAQCEYAFLHDADAFFIEPDGLERQYLEAKTRSMLTYGVTARWDPFFVQHGYVIPGTWELMYSTAWARSRSPMALRPGCLPTQYGEFDFDSMLYAQFLDHEPGKVGVMPKPPEFVHFNGTICAYRLFRDAHGKPVTDELFRVLLLSLIEDAFHVAKDRAVCPDLSELARGLTESDAPVLYQSEINRVGYPEFRNMVETMCQSPAFAGPRAVRIREQLLTFDRHFQWNPQAAFSSALSQGDMRRAAIQS